MIRKKKINVKKGEKIVVKWAKAIIGLQGMILDYVTNLIDFMLSGICIENNIHLELSK